MEPRSYRLRADEEDAGLPEARETTTAAAGATRLPRRVTASSRRRCREAAGGPWSREQRRRYCKLPESQGGVNDNSAAARLPEGHGAANDDGADNPDDKQSYGFLLGVV
jgi:hypothetical protein